MNKIEVGNVGVGRVFAHNNALFVVAPFDWVEEKYSNICIATKNHDDYDIGREYWFNENTMVTEIDTNELKKLLDN
jgi:hypothetical protein